MASLERELAGKARMIAIPFAGGERARAMAQTVQAQLTVIDRAGQVPVNSEAVPAHAEN
jgi:hypothetical protein